MLAPVSLCMRGAGGAPVAPPLGLPSSICWRASRPTSTGGAAGVPEEDIAPCLGAGINNLRAQGRRDLADNEGRREARAGEGREAEEAERRNTKQNTSRQSKPKQRAARGRRRERRRKDELMQEEREPACRAMYIFKQAPY